MSCIDIFPLIYKDEGKKIGIRHVPDAETKARLMACGELKYSQTYKSWYLPYGKETFTKLQAHFDKLNVSQDNAPARTEHKAHQTGIANDPAPHQASTGQSLRIVAFENRGWLVECDFKIGSLIKENIAGAFWHKDKCCWFVPARKGNFANLKALTGIEIPHLVFEQRTFPEKAILQVHPEDPESVLVVLPYQAVAWQIIKTTKTRQTV